MDALGSSVFGPRLGELAREAQELTKELADAAAAAPLGTDAAAAVVREAVRLLSRGESHESTSSSSMSSHETSLSHEFSLPRATMTRISGKTDLMKAELIKAEEGDDGSEAEFDLEESAATSKVRRSSSASSLTSPPPHTPSHSHGFAPIAPLSSSHAGSPGVGEGRESVAPGSMSGGGGGGGGGFDGDSEGTKARKKLEAGLLAACHWRRVVSELSEEDCASAGRYVFADASTEGEVLLWATSDGDSALCTLCGLRAEALCSPLLPAPSANATEADLDAALVALEAKAHAASEAARTAAEAARARAVRAARAATGSASAAAAAAAAAAESVASLKAANKLLQQGSGPVTHHCCALALLAARGESDARRRAGVEQADLIEPAAACGRGRTRALGQDRRGHAYWHFAGHRSAVFVRRGGGCAVGGRGPWRMYEGAAEVARLVAALDPNHVKDARLLALLPILLGESTALNGSEASKVLFFLFSRLR